MANSLTAARYMAAIERVRLRALRALELGSAPRRDDTIAELEAQLAALERTLVATAAEGRDSALARRLELGPDELDFLWTAVALTADPRLWPHLQRLGGGDTARGASVGLHALLARLDGDGALGLGLASHLAIDRALHPLINALARAHPHGDHGSSHREVEKFQSICFHEVHLGRDLMGDAGISRYLTIALVGELDRPALARPILAAFARAFGDAPTPRELARLGRGYRTHAWLLGTPLGRRIAPPAAKDAARPKFLHGPWGTFAEHLAAAIAASLAVIDAAAAVLDAGPRDVAAAHAALARVLPPGTIDPAGAEVELGRRFTVALPTAA